MKLNDTRDLNYTEITMRLRRIVNGGCLVEPLDWLAESSIAQGGISFAKDPLGLGSSSFGVLPQCHHPVHLSVGLLSSYQVIKRSACLSLVHVIVTYIWRARVYGMKGRCMY